MSNAKTRKAAGGISRIKWAYVVISIFLMALGICTLVWPGITSATVCSAIGAAAVLFGILKILAYFMHEITSVAQNYDFSIGTLAVIAGLVLLISRDRVVDLLQVVIGIYLIIDSVFKLQTALDAKRLNVSGWWISLFFTIACLALGIVLVNTVDSSLLMVLIGAALIADGLQNLCLVIFSAVAEKALARMNKESGTGLETATPSEQPGPTAPAAETPAEEANSSEPNQEISISETKKDEKGSDKP